MNQRIPQSAKQHFVLVAVKQHRVEADHTHRRGVPRRCGPRSCRADGRIHREVRQHLRKPPLDFRVASFDPAQHRGVDVNVVGEHSVQTVASTLVKGGGYSPNSYWIFWWLEFSVMRSIHRFSPRTRALHTVARRIVCRHAHSRLNRTTLIRQHDTCSMFCHWYRTTMPSIH